MSFESRIFRLNQYLTGWLGYFQLAQCKTLLEELDGWLRRKLRCIRLKQCKRTKAIADFLQENRVSEDQAWRVALSGKGWWRLALTPQSNLAMSKDWFSEQGLISMAERYIELKTERNRRGT
jgi:RNA-directed DNA polymerase